MANLTTSAIDNGFGPFFKQPGRENFDFTLLFEDTILSILPSSVLLATVPLRLTWLLHENRKVKASYLRTVKLILLAVFTLLQVANLAAFSISPALRTRASFAAAWLSLAVALSLGVLSYIEHSRCLRPSIIINAYLLLSIPLDAAKVRTLWLRGESPLVAGIASSTLAVKLLIFVVEAVEKRRLLLPSYISTSPEATSGLYSQGLFWWINPIFLLGYRSILREVDLFPTDENLKSRRVWEKFQNYWSKRRQLPRKHELILVVIRCFRGAIAAGIFPRLCQTFFRYLQPLLLKKVIQYVGEEQSQFSTNTGWGLAAAYGLIYFGIGVAAARHHHRAYRFATMVRGALVMAIYSKTMDLSVTALDESAAVTLMSIDVQRICDAVVLVHDVWGCTLEIAIAVWLLQAEIGLAMLGPLIVSCLMVLLTFIVSSRMAEAQKFWLAKIQTRVDIIAKMLQTMKGVKMLGLTETIVSIVHCLRNSEVTSSLNARRLSVFGLVLANFTPIFAPGVAFVIFVVIATYNGQTLDVGSAYAALSLIALLAFPIKVLSNSIPPLMGAVGCFDRIQDFLLSASRHDHRLYISTSETESSENHAEMRLGGNAFELQRLSQQASSNILPATQSILLQAKNCTLSWGDEERPIIQDVSFEISRGLTMLVGPVGCGKSCLLKGMLGEIPSSKGYIYTNDMQVAFVDQNPWIQHGTIRENIVGMSPFDQKFYSSVIYACALDGDLRNLSQGDLTPVGSAGAGLSGGQKLRVALARAVYSRRRLILLDDVFSGLDAGSEDRIFSELLGRKGLIRKSRAAVFLASHAAHRLSYADKIIALDMKGSICEQGNFTELMNARGYVSSLAARHTSESVKKPTDPAEETTVARLNESAHANAIEDLKRSAGDFSIYKYYFAATGLGNIVVFFLLMVVFAFFLQFPDLWVKFWTSAVAVNGNSVNGKYLGVFLLLKVISWLALVWVDFHCFLRMVPRSALKLHGRLLHSVKNAPLSFFTSTDIGQVVNRFSQDMNLVDFELPSSLFELVASLCIGIMQAILICLSAAYFAAVMPAVFGLMYLLQKFYLRTSRQIRLMDIEAKAPLYSNFIESLNGLITIRAFGWSSGFEEYNMALLDDSQRPYYMLFCIQRWLNLVLDLTVAGLAVLLMSMIVVLRQRLDAGLVGVAFLNLMNFNLSLTEIIKNWTSLETSLGAISRVKSFVQDTEDEHLPQENQPLPNDWPSKGSISFVNVTASYVRNGKAVLNGVNLEISPGERIGLVGRSGSGKSSFVATLFHMLEINGGFINVDNVNLSTVRREDVRRRLNVIPQDCVFLSGTIRTNLDPYAVAQGEDLLISALRRVGLWDKVFDAGGLDVPMEPENLLSHGQRQLFCLARAIVSKHQSRILVLDEATASVDIQTDETMQRIIRSDFRDCTIIAVAHRLETIRDFDRIVVLDQGKVVEEGNPDVLMNNESSHFKCLWNS